MTENVTHLRTLIVEDNPEDVALIVRHLSHRGEYRVEFEHVETRPDMQSALVYDWHVILCDYVLPKFQWPGALELSLIMQPTTPFIVLSGFMDDDRGRAAILAGASAYLDKRDLERLPMLVRQQIDLARVMRRNVNQAAKVIGKGSTGPLKD